MATKRKRNRSADNIIAEVFRGERGVRAPKRKARKRKAARRETVPSLQDATLQLSLTMISATLEATAIGIERINAELKLHKELLSQIHNTLQQHDQRIHTLEQAPPAQAPSDEPVVFDEGHPRPTGGGLD